MIEKCVVGFSGGVDSVVASLLLKERGYAVHGVTFIFSDEHNLPEFKNHVQQVARQIGIEHWFIDLIQIFRESVMQYFSDGYVAGITPNPCVFCNNHVKWPQLFKVADELGIKKVATGHYAQIVDFHNSLAIRKGEDPDKDQSFFLWGLRQEYLARIILPLGGMEKERVKRLAANASLIQVANQKESTGACFVKHNYRDVLKDLLTDNDLPGHGNFISATNQVLGRHDGYFYYTVGQRRGLGINKSHKLFVKTIYPQTNQVVLSGAQDLWSSGFELLDYEIHFPEIVLKQVLEVKIRYRGQYACGRLYKDGNRLMVNLIEPEWAIGPGQTAALYYEGVLVGGGFIGSVNSQ